MVIFGAANSVRSNKLHSMTKISAVIITFNEEKNIGRCIDSVRLLADEIVVLDSFSTDDTCSIAHEKGAMIHQQGFAGYIEQKNKALVLATHNYVLSLDADEAIDEKLLQSLIWAKKKKLLGAYSMNRCTSYCGKFIRYGSWYPDKKIRLFDKQVAKWGGENPHDKILLAPGQHVSHLKGDILHYSYGSIEEHVLQNNKFSTISATTLFAKGKRTSWFKIIINPCWAFIRSYFIRFGFLDGFYGYIIAKNIAHLTFLKHSKLYQKQKNKAR